jgi:hypothetical protein
VLPPFWRSVADVLVCAAADAVDVAERLHLTGELEALSHRLSERDAEAQRLRTELEKEARSRRAAEVPGIWTGLSCILKK